jgi:hypothetical protein
MKVRLFCDVVCSDMKRRSIKKLIEDIEVSANVGDFVYDPLFEEPARIEKKSIDFPENIVTLELKYNGNIDADDFTEKIKREGWKIESESDWDGGITMVKL